MKTVYPPAIRAAQITGSFASKGAIRPSVRRVKLTHARAATRKKIFQIFQCIGSGRITAEPLSDQAPGRSLVYIATDPRSACQISKFQNFHIFLNSHQPKKCFLPDRPKKKSRILRYRKCKKKKKANSWIKKKERQRQLAPPTPKR
jgi:hypothetical protein